MILRIDRLATQLPPPSEPDPEGAKVVQEIMGGRFGEMSTLMNYMFQSFNFRGRQSARPFYDLVANIAAEEWGHVELVAATINTMLTDPGAEGSPEGAPLEHLKDRPTNPHHFIAGGFGALPQNSQGRPWNGDYVHATGNLIQDLTFNYLLESGARREKLRCYEACDHPAARALFGYLLVRGGVHQVAYARAIENLTGADISKLLPSPRIDTQRIPECRPHIEAGTHRKLYRFSPSDYLELAAVFNGPHPETGEELFVEDQIPEGAPWTDLPPQPTPFVPDYDPAEIAEVAQRLRVAAGLPDEPTGEVIPASPDGLAGKVKDVVDKVTP